MAGHIWNLYGPADKCEQPEDGRDVVWLTQEFWHSLMPNKLREFTAKAVSGMPEGEDDCGMRAWRYVEDKGGQ